MGSEDTAVATDAKAAARKPPQFHLTTQSEKGYAEKVGAAWENQYGGFNVRLSKDLPKDAKIEMRPFKEKLQEKEQEEGPER